MSNTQFAFLNRASVPDRRALQASIDAMGFDLELYPDFARFEDSGFLPCTLNGEEGPGFEISYDSASDVIDDDEDFASVADGRDFCISMVWRSSVKDLACVNDRELCARARFWRHRFVRGRPARTSRQDARSHPERSRRAGG